MQLLAGRYGLGEALGQGGSSVVHHGFDNTLKRSVAIKIFDETATDVLREARTAAGLNHPNIAQVYDYGEVVDGRTRTPYLVMEFVDGETLADRLARTGALRWREAAGICTDVAAALAAAHTQSLVHRDVNPRNIMLTADGVKVLDFGIAAAAGQNGIDTGGGLWGSPAHLAPEQLRGEPAYPSADVYALGLLLFECLSGSRAWPGGSVGEILATRYGRPAPRLPRILGLPRDVARLYEACTTEDPGGRPSAIDVSEAFRRVTGPVRPLTVIRSGSGSTATEPVTPSRRSRRRATVMASAAVVAAVVSIFGVQLANGTVTPGGKEAEAAVDGGHPATTSPRPTTAAPSPTTPSVREVAATKPVTVRKKNRRTTRVTTPTTAPATPPPTTKPSAPPSKPPVTTPPAKPQPTPTRTPDAPPPPTEPTVEPTEPEATPPPAEETPAEENPPATTGPEVPEGGRLAV
ncbi:serine/threonine-protein kinase [Paractinoplanes maris]|uniref:serine/threonine-protein kinase n=1 Tax=Paractinoplanes maris TaxID=1734446 RepID=UPI00202185D2|nr:serine/threonine-protein kinase [Actinoplanes maris]